MFHPASGVKRDRNGVLHVKRVWGLYQSSKPGHHVRWDQDINASINMFKLFTQLYHEGTVPTPFLRATPKDQLERPVALRYKYKWDKAAHRLQRWTAASEAA